MSSKKIPSAKFSSACIYAVAELLIELLEFDSKTNTYFLPEAKSAICLPANIVGACKREFELQSETL